MNNPAGRITILGTSLPLFAAEEQARDETLYCISLWQPWAQWVMLGWKTIETRTHDRFRSLVGKTIGIHAALHWDNQAAIAAQDYLESWQIHQVYQQRSDVTKSGKILGTVFVNQSRILTDADSRSAMIECSTRRFGLFLSNPTPYQEPIFARGKQGIWKYTA